MLLWLFTGQPARPQPAAADDSGQRIQHSSVLRQQQAAKAQRYADQANATFRRQLRRQLRRESQCTRCGDAEHKIECLQACLEFLDSELHRLQRTRAKPLRNQLSLLKNRVSDLHTVVSGILDAPSISIESDGAGEIWEGSGTPRESRCQRRRHIEMVLGASAWSLGPFVTSTSNAALRIDGLDQPVILICQGLVEAAQRILEPHALPLLQPDTESIYLTCQGDISGAREFQTQVVEAARRTLGPAHVDTLCSKNLLASILVDEGNLRGGRELQEQVLKARKRLLGSDHRDTLVAMNNLAVTLHAAGDMGRARALQELALETQKRVLGPGDPQTLITTINLATTVAALGDTDRARQLQERALDALKRILRADHPATLVSMNQLALTLRAQGDLRSALGLHEQVLEARKRTLGSDHPATLTAMGHLAVSLSAQGNLINARKLQEQVLEAFKRIRGPSHPETLVAMNNLALILHAQGDLQGARELEEQVVAAQRQVLGADHPNTLRFKNNLAGTLRTQGDLSLARELQEQVLETRRRILGPGHPDTLISMNSLAETLQAQGDQVGARELLEQVLEAQKGLLGPDHPDTLVTMNNLAGSLRAQEDYALARELQEQTLEARQRILGPDHPDTLFSKNSLALILKDQENLDGARELQEQVLDAQRQVLGLDHPDTLTSMYDLAETLGAEGDLVGAKRLYEGSLPRLRALLPGTLQEAATLWHLGALHRQSQRLDLATDDFRRAIDALEAHIGQLGGTRNLRASYRARFVAVYRAAIELFADMRLAEESLETLERYRAQSFLEMLQERDLIFTDVPEDLDAARRSIAARYSQRFSDLGSAEDQGEVEALAAELKQLRRERDDLEVKIRRASPRLAALRDPRPLDARAIRETLDPGTVMLSYNVGEERSQLFVVTRGGLRLETLEIGAESLRRDVELFRDRIRQARPGALFAESYVPTGKRLYATLIEPAAAIVEASDRLLIIPDGPLHLLPFAALIRDGERNAPDGARNWQFLVEWKPIHSVLSATVYAEIKASRRSAGPAAGPPPLQLAAFGDPIYPAIDREERRNVGDLHLRAAAGRGYLEGLARLEHTRREIRQIRDLYPAAEARAYLGEAATEDQAKAIANEARILHFAVHGVLDHRIPLDSFLALSIPESPARDRDNGLLQAWEIFERVRLDADLVVLSACETALGQELGGEGLIGLTRAFQYAGARSVAATLWSVDDEATAELMVRFHRHLRTGKPKDEALRAAQLELLRDPVSIRSPKGEEIDRDLSAPVFWAAFQIIGDWQ